MSSALLIMDKLLGDEGLAEKVRFFALLRATTSFKCEQDQSETGLFGSVVGEARRLLLKKGLEATLEQAERALEAGGERAFEAGLLEVCIPGSHQQGATPILLSTPDAYTVRCAGG